MKEWAIVSKKVYWDRDVPLDRWCEKISAGHRSYLPDAVSTMKPAEFIRFYGRENFVQDWPAIRAKLPGESLQYAPMFDLAWSQAAGGGFNLRPAEDFYSIPEKRRAFLTEVARHPGVSIYAASKALGLQYRRSHDHATRLMAEGRIRAVEAVRNGRRALMLYPR
ncbi:MAG: hypothetical protein HO274_10790 [Ferrovum myxofaciens]|uniref:hypothetical protein n=1 Tax=Ferrovum myxofaciens TaxID=416213 RepID=UPI0023547619|nr:hypothetical protein [Ferrovum myxofaciens]QKE41739.1 MAG: hypothetical protein HO274_10790 [Ferrovum myxofaciens]